MRQAYDVYLGWGNPRTAVAITGKDIVILIKKHDAKVVLGVDAKLCVETLKKFSAHSTGIQRSDEMESLLASVPAHENHLPVYNQIFDKFWGKGVSPYDTAT